MEFTLAFNPATKITLDMEHVTMFFADPNEKKMVTVLCHSQPEVIACSYAAFKQLHAAYWEAKEPTVTISSQWDPENVKIPDCTITTTNAPTDHMDFAKYRMQGTGYWNDPITMHRKPKKTVKRVKVPKVPKASKVTKKAKKK